MSASLENAAITGRTRRYALTGIHHEPILATLLWETTLEDLADLLRRGSRIFGLVEYIHSRAQLLNLVERELILDQQPRRRPHRRQPWGTHATGGEGRQAGPRRRRSLQYPLVKELPQPSPEPLQRRKEREHFLGRGNPRRPSKN